jgi:hypothetical protein
MRDFSAKRWDDQNAGATTAQLDEPEICDPRLRRSGPRSGKQ